MASLGGQGATKGKEGEMREGEREEGGEADVRM